MSKRNKKSKEDKIMLAAFDTETEGLNGRITKIGFTLDGKRVIETTPETFMWYLNSEAEAQDKDIYVYAHKLDFDISKVLQYCDGGRLHFDPKNLLVIGGDIVKAKFEEYPRITFCDSYKLVPSKLEDITEKYNLEASKLKIDYKKFGFDSKGEYFKHAKEVDPEHFQKYWEEDVKAVYQLLEVIMQENNLTKEELVKTPTCPSLAMKLYKRECPDKFNLIGAQENLSFIEQFFRMGYVGGRTEVFKPRLEGNGYHYDINSLYPYVMHEHAYPVGKPYPIYNSMEAWQAYEDMKEGKSEYKACMLHCKVYAPETIKYPVLPFRTEEKLLFPAGIFSGVWCNPELEEAERQGYKILEVYEGVFWKETEYLFTEIIDKWSKIKMTATGARRENVKLLQNSLYGKFGMNRKRPHYMRFNKEKYEELKKKGIRCAVKVIKGEEWIEYDQNSHADYIHPEISAFITCYARLWLYRAIKVAESIGANIYYGDTDSLVLDKQLPDSEIDSAIYGKFKLENKIAQAVFIQPKLYAELTTSGEFIPKSKGLVKEYRDKVTFDSYLDLYEAAKRKERKELYSGIEGKRKTLTALKRGIEIDKPWLMRKGVDFGKEQKRELLFDINDSKPVIVDNGKWYCREWNGFLKVACSIKSEQYARSKGLTPADKEKWYKAKEEGRLLYYKECGIITRETRIREREENAS